MKLGKVLSEVRKIQRIPYVYLYSLKKLREVVPPPLIEILATPLYYIHTECISSVLRCNLAQL